MPHTVNAPLSNMIHLSMASHWIDSHFIPGALWTAITLRWQAGEGYYRLLNWAQVLTPTLTQPHISMLNWTLWKWHSLSHTPACWTNSVEMALTEPHTGILNKLCGNGTHWATHRHTEQTLRKWHSLSHTPAYWTNSAEMALIEPHTGMLSWNQWKYSLSKTPACWTKQRE